MNETETMNANEAGNETETVVEVSTAETKEAKRQKRNEYARAYYKAHKAARIEACKRCRQKKAAVKKAAQAVRDAQAAA